MRPSPLECVPSGKMGTDAGDVMCYVEAELMKHEEWFQSLMSTIDLLLDTNDTLIDRLDGLEARLDMMDKEAATRGKAQPK